MFRQISLDVLTGLPVAQLDKLKNQADGTFNKFQEVFAFDVEGNPKATRDAFVKWADDAYDPLWTQLHEAIGYSVRSSMDFGALEREARSHMKAVQDVAKGLEKELQARKKEADAALEAIKKVAAEQGVSQQAIYFKEESDRHEKEAAAWLKTTTRSTIESPRVFRRLVYLSPATIAGVS